MLEKDKEMIIIKKMIDLCKVQELGSVSQRIGIAILHKISMNPTFASLLYTLEIE